MGTESSRARSHTASDTCHERGGQTVETTALTPTVCGCDGEWWSTLSSQTRRGLVHATSRILSRISRRPDAHTSTQLPADGAGTVTFQMVDKYGDDVDILCAGDQRDDNHIRLSLPCALDLHPGSLLAVDIIPVDDEAEPSHAIGVVTSDRCPTAGATVHHINLSLHRLTRN